MPLGASASARKFKALMVDAGLMQHLYGMPVDVEYAKTDLLDFHAGAMAEQFVGQELVAAGRNFTTGQAAPIAARPRWTS